MKTGRPMARKYEYNGNVYTIEELSKKYGLKRQAIRNRLLRGKPLEDAFGSENKKNGNVYKIDGELYTTGMLCNLLDVAAETIRRHAKKGDLPALIKNKLRRHVEFEIIQESATFKPEAIIIRRTHENKLIMEKVKRDKPAAKPKKPEAAPEAKKNDSEFYLKDFERVRKLVRLFHLDQSKVDEEITKDTWTTVKVQKGPARFNYILRTEIPAFVQACKKQTEKAAKILKEIRPQKTLEELKAEHPLVKDERFFKLSYFPTIDSYTILTECNYTNPADRRTK